MIKKILIVFILPFLFQGCGYSTLYSNNNNKDININILETKGDQEINNYILFNLKKYSGKKGKNYSININTNYSISEISKNLEGSIDSYQLVAITQFEIESVNLRKTISIKEEIKINNLSDNFEKRNYEKSIKKNFSNSITNRLILQLSTL
jgi:hypothetical protein